MTYGTSSVLHRAALDAADRGWPVFPLHPDSKLPTGHAENRCPRTGRCAQKHQTPEMRATTDTDMIRRCWEARPYGIGLATGPAGLVVIDLDTPKTADATPPPEWAGCADGMEVFTALCVHHGQPVPDDTYTVRTGRGGLHLYFTAPEGARLRGTAGTLGWKVDTRAWGGYVVAAGSTVDGRRYVVEHDAPAAPLPTWLAHLLTPPPLPPQKPVTVPLKAADRSGRYVNAAVRAELERITTAPGGQRNNAVYLASVALGQLVAGGALDEGEATAYLTAAARQVGQGDGESARTVASGLRAGAKRPRSVAA